MGKISDFQHITACFAERERSTEFVRIFVRNSRMYIRWRQRRKSIE